MSSIRIGNGAGFWGDNLDAPRRLAETGQLDYLTLEYLAELTLSILAQQRSRDPQAGFVPDFLPFLGRLIPFFPAHPRLKTVPNAGGMAPRECARQAAAILRKASLGTNHVAAASGDD